jgi:hypothetical protein
MVTPLPLRRQVRTTTRGHRACIPARVRSARPTWCPARTSSTPDHRSRPSMTTVALTATAGRRP